MWRSDQAERSGRKVVVNKDDDESTPKFAWRCGHGGAYSPWSKIWRKLKSGVTRTGRNVVGHVGKIVGLRSAQKGNSAQARCEKHGARTLAQWHWCAYGMR